MDNRTKRRGGFYWINDVPYVTVTTVLRSIAKPALVPWASKMTYYAMVKDPSISLQEAMGATRKTSGVAKTRGLTVHKLVEDYKAGKDNLAGLTSDIKPYMEAYDDWFKSHDVHVIDHEKTVKSDKYGFMGTGDVRATLSTSSDVYLIDIKTGKGVYDEVALQLSAYQQGFKEQGEQIDKLAVLLLETGSNGKPTGNYKFVTQQPDIGTFLAVKHLWEWQNEEACHQAGYVTGRF